MADFTALRGIVCPVVSPCTSNEGVDYDSLQENLARLLRAPITGFYVCGGTGDGSRLTFAERCRTAELTIAQTRAAGRRTIVHVGQTLQRHALELAEHAMTLGADAVASVPPQGGWSETVAYYTALAAQAPVFIYYIPGLTHVSADYDQLRQLLDLPGVAGIKVSDWNIFLIRRIKADYPEKIRSIPALTKWSFRAFSTARTAPSARGSICCRSFTASSGRLRRQASARS